MANDRRGRGDRKVIFDEKRQLYIGQLSYIDEKTGKRSRPKVYSKSESECRKLMKAKERELEEGFRPEKGGKYPLRVWLEIWFKDFQKSQVRIKTQVRQDLAIRQINDYIGDIKLAKLTAEDVQQFYAYLLTSGRRQANEKDEDGKQKVLKPAGLSSGSVRYCHAVLHKSLKKAVQLQYIKSNVTEMVELPRLEKTQRKALNQEQWQQLLAAAKKHRLYGAILLSISTGLRRGELLALAWDDVDIEHNFLRVKNSLLEAHKHGVFFDEVKSKSSRRIVYFPPDVAEELKLQKEKLNADKIKAYKKAKEHAEKFNVEIDPSTYYKDSGLLFQQVNGERMDPRSFSRTFESILKDAKLPHFPLHSLRHTYATIMLQKGVHLKLVQESMGHSTIQQTADTYSHVIPGMAEGSAMLLDGMFIKKEPEKETTKE